MFLFFLIRNCCKTTPHPNPLPQGVSEYSSLITAFQPSPVGRGAAVFEAGAENYGCGEGAGKTTNLIH